MIVIADLTPSQWAVVVLALALGFICSLAGYRIGHWRKRAEVAEEDMSDADFAVDVLQDAFSELKDESDRKWCESNAIIRELAHQRDSYVRQLEYFAHEMTRPEFIEARRKVNARMN